MKRLFLRAFRHYFSLLPCSLALWGVCAHAQPATQNSAPKPRPAPRDRAQLDSLQKRLAQQTMLLEDMRKALGEQDARYQELQRSLGELRAQQQQAQRQAQLQRQQQQPSQQQRAAQAPAPLTAPSAPQRPVRVGTAPPAPEPPRNVATLFDQPGVLTPRGQTIFEPSLQYGYSSNNRVALVGFTVVPALLIGLVDVREVKRNTLVGALTVRRGLSNRFELEGRIPYVYRSDNTVSREIFTGTATENVFHTSGRGIGDIEATARYQLTQGNANFPYLIGSLRFKSRTGKDPFEVTTDCVTRCVGNTTGTGQPLGLPTGSGFYTLQPGLTWLYQSDPAVFFGSFTYGRNFKRSGLSRRVLGGESEFIGEVKPGDVLGMNVGMGLALNERSSFSLGVDLASIGRTKQNGAPVPGSVRTQLATLMLGYSHRYNETRTVNVSVGAGLTRDTPDLTLTVRVPFTF